MTQAKKQKDNYFSAYKVFAETREGKDPAWLVNLREKAGESFERLDFPTTRDEEWKYTNVAPILKTPFRRIFDPGDERPELTAESIAQYTFPEAGQSRLVFVNGLFSSALSNVSDLPADSPDGVVVANLSEALSRHEKLISDHLAAYADYRDEVFTAINTALLKDGGFVYIPNGKAVEAPIHLLFISTEKEPAAAHPRVLIIAGEGSIGTIIESYVSLGDETYFTNAVTEAFVGKRSVITHYRLQEESEKAFHIATTRVYQERDSNYSSCSISIGGEIVRHDLNVALTDERIETTIDGLYVVTGKQHVDNHTTIDHQKPHCASRQLYKGILDDKARAVFNGKIIVREGALLTDARQLNKNLLLSSEATANAKPQLEIFADDVKCSHGATVGQLEDDELFYLSSRGLPPERARALLTYGFAEEVISRIKLQSVREQLDRMTLDKLHQDLP